MVIVFKKSLLKSAAAKKFVKEAKFHYFQEKILEHLDRLEKKEKEQEEAVQKALNKAGFPVGTVRNWSGKKYMKIAPGKWRRKYESDSSGAKQSIAAIKKKINACKTSKELFQVIKENKHRFTNAEGKYLSFVKELFTHVSETKKKIKGAGNAAQSAKKMDSIIYERNESVHGANSPHGADAPTKPTIQQSDDSANKKSEKTAKLSAAQIMQAGKKGERVRYDDIDWDSLEKDGEKAKKAITKQNVLGDVSESALKKKGIKKEAIQHIKTLYDAVGDKPLQDTPEARRAYVRGINALRDKLEKAKTEDSFYGARDAIREALEGSSYRWELIQTDEYRDKKAAMEDEARGASESRDRLYEIGRKEKEARNAAGARLVKRIEAWLRENGAMQEGERIKYNSDWERYIGRLEGEKREEHDRFLEEAKNSEQARLNEKLRKIDAERKAETAALKEAEGKANKARADFEKWEDGQIKAMANADPLYEGWVQLGDKFRETLEPI